MDITYRIIRLASNLGDIVLGAQKFNQGDNNGAIFTTSQIIKI